MLIGEKIRVIRESEDLTREEFCGLIDVAYRHFASL